MNFPNILTIGRIVLIMIFVLLASYAGDSFMMDSNMPDNIRAIRLTAYFLAIFAAFTDLLDGYLARKWNQVTEFGALMDPLADKIFITATMLVAIEFRLMPAWIGVLVISREFMVTGLRTMAAKRNILISADKWGKIKTVLQMLMVGLAGASWVGWFNLQEDIWHGIRLWTVWNVYLTGVVLVTVGSGAAYFVRFRHVFLPTKEKNVE